MQNSRYTRSISLFRSRFTNWYRHRLGWVPTIVWIIGLALIVRLPDFGAPLWYDEVFSASVARLPVDKLLSASAGDVHPPGYYLLLKAVIMTIGGSEIAMRLPSLFAGLTLLWLVYRLAGAIGFTPGQQTASALIVALSPFQIYYSQELRSYSLVMAALTLAALGLVERRRAWFIIGCAGALYLNTMSAFVVIGLGLAGLRLDRTRPFFMSVAIIGLLYIPAGLMVASQIGAMSAGYWVLPPFTPGRLLAVVDDLFYFTPQTTFVFASAIVTACGIIIVVKSINLPVLMDRPAPYLLLSAGPIPLFLASIVSMLWTPVLLSRAMAGSAPFLYLLIVWAVSRERRQAQIWYGAALATALAVWIGTVTGPMGRGGWSQNIPADAFFYASVGDYLPNRYYHPESAHYLLQTDHNIANDLTPQTKEALSIESASPDIICRTPADTWSVNLTLTVLSTPADADAITGLKQRLQGYPVVYSSNEASTNSVYSVDCRKLSQTTQ